MLSVEARFASLQAFAASLSAWRPHPAIEKGFKSLRGFDEPATPRA